MTPAELLARSRRHDDRYGDGPEPLTDLAHAGVVVRPEPVQLVDEADARDVVVVGLVPDRLRLGLHALHAVEDHDGAVEHAQRPLDLRGEVHVPRGVDEVQLAVAPVEGRRGRRDGDAPLALVLAEVHHGLAVVDLPDLVALAAVEEEPLGRGRLPRVDVRDDSDVADAGERSCRHDGGGQRRLHANTRSRRRSKKRTSGKSAEPTVVRERGAVRAVGGQWSVVFSGANATAPRGTEAVKVRPRFMRPVISRLSPFLETSACAGMETSNSR